MPPINIASLSFNSSSSKAQGSLTDRATQFISDILSKSKRRNAIIYEVVLSHWFEDILLTETTFCSQCHKLIWLVPTPFAKRCVLCKLTSHKKCLGDIVSSCIKSIDNQQSLKNRESHKFKRRFFFSPTWCGHCGVLIKGFTSCQGEECDGCEMSVHFNCRQLVGILCGHQKEKIVQLSSEIKLKSRLEEEEEDKYRQTFSLSAEDFDIVGFLGKGSYSKVYLARYKHSQEGRENKFAMKVLKKTKSTPESVLTEMEVLKLAHQHPFLTAGHCCFQSKDKLYFVMEYVVGRDLVDRLVKEGKFDEDKARFYLAEIVLALNFLHNKGIVYGDLKLDHVILDRNGHCKLIDFGMCRQLTHSGMSLRTVCGTPDYLSPEVIRGQDYTFSVDWWASGVLLYELLLGYSPFEIQDDDMNELYRKIVEDEVELPRDSSISQEASSMLTGLLTKDPRDRLGCNISMGSEQAIFDHPFFLCKKDHNWDSIKALHSKPPYIPTDEDIRLSDCHKRVHQLTPVNYSELEKVYQDDFLNFSYKSEYFKALET